MRWCSTDESEQSSTLVWVFLDSLLLELVCLSIAPAQEHMCSSSCRIHESNALATHSSCLTWVLFHASLGPLIFSFLLTARSLTFSYQQVPLHLRSTSLSPPLVCCTTACLCILSGGKVDEVEEPVAGRLCFLTALSN